MKIIPLESKVWQKGQLQHTVTEHFNTGQHLKYSAPSTTECQSDLSSTGHSLHNLFTFIFKRQS